MTVASHATPLESWRPPSRGFVNTALVAGGALLGLTFLVGLFSLDRFFQAYLFAFLFWWTVSMGCLGLTLLHNLTGGNWGDAIRPFLFAGMATLLPTVLLFIPVALGVGRIYEWAHPEAAEDPLIAFKMGYLNQPFFLIRAVVYFLIFLASASIARRGAKRASAIALAALILAISFASVDWAMSLDPHWFSTMYGALYVIGGAVAAMAVSIVGLAMLAPWRNPVDRRSADVLNDLGNLLLAFVMVWAYFSFSQFLIIWAGNLPEEATWYVHRSTHGWQWVIMLVAALHFVLPFMLLLSRDVKRNPRLILYVAGGLILMRMVDLLWVVAPSFEEHGWLGILLDLAAWLGIGGLWIAIFARRLKPIPDEAHPARVKHGKKK